MGCSSWDSGLLLFFSLPLSSLPFLLSLFLTVHLLFSLFLHLYLSFSYIELLFKHYQGNYFVPPSGCRSTLGLWALLSWEEEVGHPHPSMVGTEGEITGSLGGNGLEVCVSETTPSQAGLFPKLQVQGLGGCRDSVLGEQRGLWASRGDQPCIY